MAPKFAKLEPILIELEAKKLIGIRMNMSFTNDKTKELWQCFMPRRHEVENRVTSEYISLQNYSLTGTPLFAPEAIFEKWALVEVSDLDIIPKDMESYLLGAGTYAVFIHIGPASAFASTMEYIFGKWLPKSSYRLDDRPHFEKLPEGYNPSDPDATEEIWIPVILKS